jgi:hypothetical protein
VANKVDTGSLISSSWQFFSSRFSKLWPIGLLFALPSILSVWLTDPKPITEEDLRGVTDFSGFAETFFGVSLATLGLAVLIMLVVSVIYSAVVYGGSVSSLLKALRHNGSDISVSGVFDAGKQRWGQVVLLAIAVGLIVGVGLVLLVIPGLIAAFLLSLSLHFMVDKNQGISQSMSSSFNLVKNHVGSVFMVYLMVFLISFGVSLVSGIIFGSDSSRIMQTLAALVAGLLSTFTLVVVTKLYLSLSGHSAASANNAE